MKTLVISVNREEAIKLSVENKSLLYLKNAALETDRKIAFDLFHKKGATRVQTTPEGFYCKYPFQKKPVFTDWAETSRLVRKFSKGLYNLTPNI